MEFGWISIDIAMLIFGFFGVVDGFVVGDSVSHNPDCCEAFMYSASTDSLFIGMSNVGGP